MPTVYVPSPLRRVTGGQSKVQVTGRTLEAVLTNLERQYPGVRKQVCDDTGEVRSFINVFVNGTEVRQLQGLATALTETDEVSIIPAMAGGTPTHGYKVSKRHSRVRSSSHPARVRSGDRGP
jgi:molybdopterin synthase sulfur carrier subunit